MIPWSTGTNSLGNAHLRWVFIEMWHTWCEWVKWFSIWLFDQKMSCVHNESIKKTLFEELLQMNSQPRKKITMKMLVYAVSQCTNNSAKNVSIDIVNVNVNIILTLNSKFIDLFTNVIDTFLGVITSPFHSKMLCDKSRCLNTTIT